MQVTKSGRYKISAELSCAKNVAGRRICLSFGVKKIYFKTPGTSSWYDYRVFNLKHSIYLKKGRYTVELKAAGNGAPKMGLCRMMFTRNN